MLCWILFMRAHRTQCRCLKRFSLCIIAVGLLPILIVYFLVSDQLYYRIKRTDVSIPSPYTLLTSRSTKSFCIIRFLFSYCIFCPLSFVWFCVCGFVNVCMYVDVLFESNLYNPFVVANKQMVNQPIFYY